MERTLPAPRTLDWRPLVTAASLILLSYTLVTVIAGHRAGFGDVYAYYEAWGGPLYRSHVGGAHAYLYSPAFAQAIWPFTLLPFPAFYGLLLAADVAALVYLVGWRWAGWTAVLFYPVTLELAVGNVHLLIAAAIAASFRHPTAWALPLLTKVTPGVGIAYHLVRREWRHVLYAAGSAAVIAMVSYVLAPQLWADWVALLAQGGGDDPWAFIHLPLMYRLPVALAIAAVGGWRRWEWTVPVSAMLALPVMWVSAPVLLLAIPRLRAAAAKADAPRRIVGEVAVGPHRL